jgi:UDP-glucose 4-epimerase
VILIENFKNFIGLFEMKIRVTGGAAFVGSHLVDRLLELVHKLVVIDNFDTFYTRFIKEKNLEPTKDSEKYAISDTDILNNKSIYKNLSNEKFEIVIHLAARAGV